MSNQQWPPDSNNNNNTGQGSVSPIDLQGGSHSQQPAQSGQQWSQQPPPGWDHQGAVWPPPAFTPAYSTMYFPFKFIQLKVRGGIADFREGAVGIDAGGITINGKEQPRAEIFQTVWIICFILFRLLGLIAYLIMRYAMLKPSQLNLPWNQVQEIVFVPKKRRACIVYDAPNYKGKLKTWSLAFTLPANEFEQFMGLARQYAPNHAHEGKIGSPDAMLRIILALIILALVAFGFYLSMH